jgi:hypothetical protein
VTRCAGKYTQRYLLGLLIDPNYLSGYRNLNWSGTGLVSRLYWIFAVGIFAVLSTRRFLSFGPSQLATR